MRPRKCAFPAALLAVALTAGACASADATGGRCDSERRLALVAQSVPNASYVPCIGELRPGWSVDGFNVSSGNSRFQLESDRSRGRPVEIELRPACEVAGTAPMKPRAEGVRTHIRLRSVAPRYAGTLYDVFPGGCVTYVFDFARGPHISLMEELQQSVQLYPRRELRLEVRDETGVEIDPE